MAEMNEDVHDDRLLGVCLVYCRGNVRKETWVDMAKVKAIAWSAAAIPSRPGNPSGGPARIPHGKAPGNCGSATDEDTAAASATQEAEAGTVMYASAMTSASRTREPVLCWWDGNQWICGDAIE